MWQVRGQKWCEDNSILPFLAIPVLHYFLRAFWKKYFFFFLFVFPPVWQLAFNISPTFSPFSPFPLVSFFPFLSPVTSATAFPTARATFLPYRQSYHPWECNRSHSILCCIAFTRGHRETAENLCRYSRPFNRVCPQSNSLWKMTSRSAFRCAGRGPAVTDPSTDLTKSCSTWVIDWDRTPTTHRTLSVFLEKVLVSIKKQSFLYVICISSRS